MALVHKAQPLSGGNKLYLYKNGVTNTDFVTSWETRNGTTIGENTLEFPTYSGDSRNYNGRDIYSSNEVNLSGYKAICARLNVSTVGAMHLNSTFYLMLSPTKTRGIAQAYAASALQGVAITDNEIIMSSPILNDIAYICMFTSVYYSSDSITISISEIWLEK